jgi:hypothetical protein
MKRLFFIVFTLFFCLYVEAQSKFNLDGKITDNKGIPLVGARIVVKELTKTTITDGIGSFNFKLDKGNYILIVSYIGYVEQKVPVKLEGNKSVNIILNDEVRELESVEVTADAPNHNVTKMEMSANKLEMKQIQKLPVVFGEGDIIKTLQLLPGVIPAGEASGGFHVRGGNIDQNLILIDKAQVYNASHFVGFFSVFNSNAVDDMKLYKGGIPSEYGGRLSSVLDIKTIDGDMDNYSGEASVGVISSKLLLNGPIVKEKVSLYVAGRRTYADLFFPFAKDSIAKESSLYFYDLNAKLKAVLGPNDRLTISAYKGRDAFVMGSSMSEKFGNQAYTANWNHTFDKKLFLNTYLTSSIYDNQMKFTEDTNSGGFTTRIFDLSFRSIFTIKTNDENEMKFGVEVTRHDFNPGEFTATMYDTNFDYKLSNTYSFEYGLFFQNQHAITPKLSVIYGFRYSTFYNIGKGKLYKFDTSNPNDYMPIDTINYSKGEIYNFFPKGFEPRLSLRYLLNESSSIKLSYNRMYQYIQLASNSTSSLPLEFWFPSSPNIKPQFADQIAAGYFKNFGDNAYELTVETFYKKIHNTVDFKDHANLMLNELYEGQIRTGKAWAYGAEFMIKKQEGKFTGWISYTYSRVFKQIDEINNGKAYPAAYDKPHDVAIVASYDVTDRLNVSGTWVYISAPPRTMPIKKWEYDGMTAPSYGERNSVRVFNYHRLDLAATYRLNKVKHSWEHSINVSVYNAYAHHNYIWVSFEEDPDHEGRTIAKGNYLYTFVPSISYQIKF